MPRTFTKDGETRTVNTNRAAVELAWLGWKEVTEDAAPAPIADQPTPAPAQQAAPAQPAPIPAPTDQPTSNPEAPTAADVLGQATPENGELAQAEAALEQAQAAEAVAQQAVEAAKAQEAQ